MRRDGSEFNSNVYVSNIRASFEGARPRASFEGARPRASFEPELRTKQYDMEMVSVKAIRPSFEMARPIDRNPPKSVFECESAVSVMNIRKSFDEPNPIRLEQRQQVIISDIIDRKLPKSVFEYDSAVSVMNIRKSFDEPNPIRREQKQVIIPDIKVSVKNKRAAFEVETLVKRETFAKSSSNLIIGDYVPPGRNISSVKNSIADNASAGLISKNSIEVNKAEPVSSLSHDLTIKRERRRKEPERIANVSNTNPTLDSEVSSDSELPSRDLTIKEEARRVIFNDDAEYIEDPLDMCKLPYLFLRHRKFLLF
jgi:hypothetical protein